MSFFSFENLEIYQLAQDYAEEVYLASENFPSKEKFGLTNQLRRAAGSVSFNIAEGKARGSNADFARFLYIARGSLLESVSQLQLSLRLKYLDSSKAEALYARASQLNGKINAFIRSLGGEP